MVLRGLTCIFSRCNNQNSIGEKESILSTVKKENQDEFLTNNSFVIWLYKTFSPFL